MPEINKIRNIDNNNIYSVSSGKVNTENNVEFTSFLGESKSMDEIFQQAAEKYNVPVELLKSIGKAESDFNPNAVSRCGAMGVMQLMPGTAKELGVTDAFDPEQNIMGGAKYIAGLLKKYNGDTKLALAAYNAGSNNVKKYGGIPPFEETQNYVKKVMKFMGQGDLEIASRYNNYTKSSASEDATISVRPSNSPATLVTNNSYLLANGDIEAIEELSDFDMLFSYDDYLKFIDLLLSEISDKEDNEKEKAYYVKDINYSPSVINLLKSQNLI